MSKHKTRKEKVIAQLRRKLSATEYTKQAVISRPHPLSFPTVIPSPHQATATLAPSYMYIDLLRTLILTTSIIVFEIILHFLI